MTKQGIIGQDADVIALADIYEAYLRQVAATAPEGDAAVITAQADQVRLHRNRAAVAPGQIAERAAAILRTELDTAARRIIGLPPDSS